jgi:isopenicillin-N epimerase
LIDGAHVPGQLVLDAPALGADWYTGNAHKWLFAPKGCGILWTAPARRNETHPAVTSHGWGSGYAAEFDWIGTRDPSPWLCFGAAAKAHDGFGGAALRARNIALAKDAGDTLATRMHAPRAAPSTMQCAMTALRLAPLGTPEEALKLRRRLAREHNIEVPVFVFENALWLRVSAQIYNESDDYERLAEALGKLLDK